MSWSVELHNMSKTEGIAELYFETKKVNWESARINMPDNMTINGYFCGLYSVDDKEEYEFSETETHKDRCDVCKLIKEMNKSINKSTIKKMKKNERLIVTNEILTMQIQRLKEAEQQRQEIRDRKHWDLFDQQRKILNRMLKDNKKAREEEFARKIRKDVNNIYKSFKNKENQAIKSTEK